MRNLSLLKSSIIGCALIGATTANAQMVGGDIFLKGTYVEVGIGHLGYYGSDSVAPAGYHPHLSYTSTTGQPLGFVADPNMTSWSNDTTSAITHYMGDYFYPGDPFEGWELQVDSSRCHAFNSGPGTPFACSDTGIVSTTSGSNLSYTTSGSKVIGTWQGMVDSVQVTQVTTLDTNAFYFTVQVTLTNTSSSPLNNVYYTRTLDPDNDESWPGGSFTTNNVIEYQAPDSMNASLVTATGLSTTTSIMGLGIVDTNSTAYTYVPWPIDVHQDLAAVYNQTWGSGSTAFYDVGVNHPGDYSIGIVIKIPHLASVDSAADSVYRTTATAMRHPANKATFTYFYAFGQAGIDSALKNTNPYSPATTTTTGEGVKNVNTIADINVYPNPAKNIINISGLNATDQLSLYDMMGRAMEQNWNVNGQGVNTFSVNNLPAGAYILVVKDANGNTRSRVPLQKQ